MPYGLLIFLGHIIYYVPRINFESKKTKRFFKNLIMFISLILLSFSGDIIFFQKIDVFNNLGTSYQIYTSIGSVLFFYCLNMSRSLKKLLSLAPIVFLGKISFCIYLIHYYIVIGYSKKVLSTIDFSFTLISTFLIVLILSSLIHIFLEIPLLNRLNKNLLTKP